MLTSLAQANKIDRDGGIDADITHSKAVDEQRIFLFAELPLPDSPGVLRLAITEVGVHVPLPVLQQLVERVRFREGAESGPARAEWTALRASAHAALAQRGSRLALYDLKESFESSRDPLPVEFLGAVAAVGDASCLEPLAAAYNRAADNGRRVDDWWRGLVGWAECDHLRCGGRRGKSAAGERERRVMDRDGRQRSRCAHLEMEGSIRNRWIHHPESSS